MKKKISDHFSISLIYLVLVSIIRFKLDLNLIPFFIGGAVGAVILYSDYLFQVLLVQPELEIAKEAKKLITEKKYKEMLVLIYSNTDKITSLTFHTILFQVVFTLFSVFIITSTNSYIGWGLSLTVLLYLLVEEFLEYKSNNKLAEQWFERINVKMSAEQQKIYLAVMTVIFVILSTFITK